MEEKIKLYKKENFKIKLKQKWKFRKKIKKKWKFWKKIKKNENCWKKNENFERKQMKIQKFIMYTISGQTKMLAYYVKIVNFRRKKIFSLKKYFNFPKIKPFKHVYFVITFKVIFWNLESSENTEISAGANLARTLVFFF